MHTHAHRQTGTCIHNTHAHRYGYLLSKGATTLVEFWSASPSVSWNHAMLGHIDAWFFEHIGGLQTATRSGPVVLSPGLSGQVDWSELRRALPSGPLTMRWERNPSNGSLKVVVGVPPGADVRLRLSDTHPTAVSVDGQPVATAMHVRLLVQRQASGVVELVLAPGSHMVTVTE